LTFLTPLGTLVALAVILPAAAIALGVRRAAAARAALRLRPPRHGTDLQVVGALAALFALLAVAAAQPALAHDVRQRVRTDAQVLFVLDTSRSMAAAPARSAPTRLARAEHLAAAMRASIPDVEAGIATLTDRVLPNLLPVADVASFDATLSRAVGIERPPPRFVTARATTFDALVGIPESGFFEHRATHRVVVLLTDGESRPFDTSALGRAFANVGLVVIGVRRSGELVFGHGGQPEPGYRPDPSTPTALAEAAATTGGRLFRENERAAASAQLRRLLGKGPTASTVGSSRRETPLAPFAALAALVPLVLLARRRGAAA
jgi:hypothetical protein